MSHARTRTADLSLRVPRLYEPHCSSPSSPWRPPRATLTCMDIWVASLGKGGGWKGAVGIAGMSGSATPYPPASGIPAGTRAPIPSLSLQLVAMATEQITDTAKGSLDKVCSPQPHP